MLSPDLRRKLSKLNTERDASEAPVPPETERRVLCIEDVVPGRVHFHEQGELFVCEQSAADLRPDLVAPETILQALKKLHLRPRETLFLDIETCGLANRPLFLVGVLSIREDGPWIEQFFARDYSEERSVLAHIVDVAGAYHGLVTFNGKSFDIPYIRDRMRYHRLSGDFDHKHLDVLQRARRKWRAILPDCRLSTLEECMCKQRRYGDTPGDLIPQLYHSFVKSGNAGPMEGVFRHNALDLITMAELLPLLVR